MRITMVTSSLGSGGAERVMATMANWWAARGRRVEIVTLADTPSFYPLDPRVRHTGLGLRGASGNPARAVVANARRWWALRGAIRAGEPDVVISFLTAANVQTLLATRGMRTAGAGALEGLPYGAGGGRSGARRVPVIVEEHTDPTMEAIHPVWRRLRRVVYPWADRVLVLSDVARGYFPPAIRDKTEVMPNPIVVDPPGDVTHGERRQLVSMGRFTEEKGFDRLLDAFAALAPEFPEWDLVVWGDGPLRGDLEAQRERLGLPRHELKQRVRMPGRTRAPHDRLREADLYALPSRREGFPMALGEALGCGLPAVAFDLPSGPRALIRDGIDGILVPNGDGQAFVGALRTLMRDDAVRAAMAARAPEVLGRYGVEAVMGRWERLLGEVVGRRGQAG